MNTAKPRKFAHHFDSAEHEYSSSKEGVWLFLMSEILMFGAIFAAYIIYNMQYPEVFEQGAKALDWRLGAVNTVVLITSSLTMVLGIYFCQKNESNKAFWSLLATVACALAFMGIKYIEYSHKIHEGLLPGAMYSADTHGLENIGLYFSFYFMMTGLHGIHVLLGAGMIFWLAMKAKRGDFNENYYTPVEGIGLFWHIVDLIWIFLFPLLYLVG